MNYYLFLIATIYSISACKTAPVAPAVDFKGAWNNPEWDAILVNEIESQGLPDVASIADAKDYCPKYSSLSKAQKTEFWARLMVAMAKKESGFDSSQTYKEKFKNSKGEYVISTGLFQISYESSSSSSYKCGKQTTEGLKNPKTNIECSVKILARWAKADQYAGKTIAKDTFRGGARYWSVLRSDSGSNPYVMAEAKKAPGCI